MAATCDASAVGCWGPRKVTEAFCYKCFTVLEILLPCWRKQLWVVSFKRHLSAVAGLVGEGEQALHVASCIWSVESGKSSHSVNWLFCIFKPWIIFYWKYYENRRGNIRIPLIENRNIQTTDKWWYRERLDEEEFNEQYLTNPKSMIRSHLFDCQVYQVWFKS